MTQSGQNVLLFTDPCLDLPFLDLPCCQLFPQVNRKLKDLVKSAVNPETDEINTLSNLVDEFTYAFVDPLRSNSDTRTTFERCLDYVVDKAIDTKQKKVTNMNLVESI